MKERIFTFANQLNIEYIGVAPLMYYKELDARIQKRKEKYGLSEFEEADTIKRVNPKLAFPWAKSIIVCLFPYYTGEDEDANVSRYARIPDYHKVAKDKLLTICDFIKEESGARCEAFADTGVLHDRFLAYLAGLGFFGLNTCLINEKYGTYFFIGYIVTDLELEADKPSFEECKKCGKCINSCSGQALDSDGNLNVNRCVSYITQIKEISEEQRKILNSQKMIYGCDRCQEVCPHNSDPVMTPIKEFYEKRQAKLEKEQLEMLSNKEFKREYGAFPFSWRGKNIILKNFDK